MSILSIPCHGQGKANSDPPSGSMSPGALPDPSRKTLCVPPGAVGTVAPRSPTMPHCSARAACETRGKRVCSARWALLSYQRRRHNGPGVLTILPSGESKPWPGSRLAGETCCRTAWLVVTMAPLPWWLMAPEDAASPLAWLYRTPARHRRHWRHPRPPERRPRVLPAPSGPPSPPTVCGTRMEMGTSS